MIVACTVAFIVMKIFLYVSYIFFLIFNVLLVENLPVFFVYCCVLCFVTTDAVPGTVPESYLLQLRVMIMEQKNKHNSTVVLVNVVLAWCLILMERSIHGQ